MAFKLSSRSYVLGPLRIPCDIYDCTKIMIIMNIVIIEVNSVSSVPHKFVNFLLPDSLYIYIWPMEHNDKSNL